MTFNEVLVLFIVLNVFRSVYSAPVHYDFDTMKWEAGDIISCSLNGFWGTLFAKHFMLATDDLHVINVAGDKSTNEGVILDQIRKNAAGFNRSRCQNNGKGKLPVKEGIERALKWLNKHVYYNLLRCNCEHWVKYWADGSSGGFFDNQSMLPTNSKCAV